MRFPRLIAGATLAIACLAAGSHVLAAPEGDPMSPIYGTWRVNIERSIDTVLADADYSGYDPEYLKSYIVGNAETMKLVFTDSLVTYYRGRHTKDMPYEMKASSGNSVTIKVMSDMDGTPDIQHWEMVLIEKDFLHLESTATNLKDFWVYERFVLPTGAVEEKPDAKE